MTHLFGFLDRVVSCVIDPDDLKLAVYKPHLYGSNNRRNELQRRCGEPSYFESSIKLSVQHSMQMWADKQTINMTKCQNGMQRWICDSAATWCE